MTTQRADRIVCEAMRDKAREIVSHAESTEVVEMATREWKRYQRRLADFTGSEMNQVAEEEEQQAVNFALAPAGNIARQL